VWDVSSGFPSLSAHNTWSYRTQTVTARRELELLLDDRFGTTHTTLQVDHQHPELGRWY
jgi:cobalt-zinc-cadmium efflux system protein